LPDSIDADRAAERSFLGGAVGQDVERLVLPAQRERRALIAVNGDRR
jgi:hypothetical protein